MLLCWHILLVSKFPQCSFLNLVFFASASTILISSTQSSALSNESTITDVFTPHHGRVHTICFTQKLVGVCCRLVVLVAVHQLLCVAARPHPNWSLRFVQSRNHVHHPSFLWIRVVCSESSVLFHTAQIPTETVVAIPKTLPNEFDRHDPSMLRGLDGEDFVTSTVSSLSLKNLELLDEQLISSWMVGFFLCLVSVMFWDVLLVFVCFTTVLTTCCTCLPTTRSMVRRWILFHSCDLRHLCITGRLLSRPWLTFRLQPFGQDP